MNRPILQKLLVFLMTLTMLFTLSPAGVFAGEEGTNALDDIPDTMQLLVDDEQYILYISPEKVEEISWTAEPEGIVTITKIAEGEESGITIIPEKVGSTTVSFKAGESEKSCDITVKNYKSISLNTESVDLEYGRSGYSFNADKGQDIKISFENVQDLPSVNIKNQNGEWCDIKVDDASGTYTFLSRKADTYNMAIDNWNESEAGTTAKMSVIAENFDGIRLSETAVNMYKKDTAPIEIIYPELTGSEQVQCSSSNEKVATVSLAEDDSFVWIEGIGEGKADIKITIGNKKAVCSVTVTDIYKTEIKFDKNGDYDSGHQSLASEENEGYYFEAIEGSKIEFTLNGWSDYFEINLYGEHGWIARAEHNGQNTATLKQILNETGTYYIKVDGCGGSLNYRLTGKKIIWDGLDLDKTTYTIGVGETAHIGISQKDEGWATIKSGDPEYVLATESSSSEYFVVTGRKESGTKGIPVKVTSGGTTKTCLIYVIDGLYEETVTAGKLSPTMTSGRKAQGYKIDVQKGQRVGIQTTGDVCCTLLDCNKTPIDEDEYGLDGNTYFADQSGTYYIRIDRASDSDENLDYTLQISLSEPRKDIGLALEEDSNEHEIYVGDKRKLITEFIPGRVESETKEWTSSDSDVIQIDKDTGLFEGKAEGKATITLKMGDVSGSFELTVIDKFKEATDWGAIKSGNKAINFGDNESSKYYKFTAETADIGKTIDFTLRYQDNNQYYFYLYNSKNEIVNNIAFWEDPDSKKIMIGEAGTYYVEVGKSIDEEEPRSEQASSCKLDFAVKDVPGFTVDKQFICLNRGDSAEINITSYNGLDLKDLEFGHYFDDGQELTYDPEVIEIEKKDEKTIVVKGIYGGTTVNEGLCILKIGNCLQFINVNVYGAATIRYTDAGILGGTVEFDPQTQEIVEVGEHVTVLEIPDQINGINVTGFKAPLSFVQELRISSHIKSIYPTTDWPENLRKITVDNNNQHFSAEDNILFNKNKSELIVYPNGKTEQTAYAIPDSVKVIKKSSLSNNTLETITIPGSVETIEEYAFLGNNIKRIIVEASNHYKVKNGSLYDVENNKILRCPPAYNAQETRSSVKTSQVNNSAQRYTIEAGTERIAEGAFADCKNLIQIVMPDSVQSIGPNAFLGCTSLRNIRISSGVQSIESGTFMLCKDITIVIPETVTNISGDALSDCDNVTIQGVPGSAAQTFADANGYKFKPITQALTNCTATLSTTAYTYDGNAKTPAVTVRDGRKTLRVNSDYTLSYKNNVNAGTASVVITGKGDYEGSITKEFTINKAAQSISGTATITKAYGSKAFSLGNRAQGALSYKTGNSKVAAVSSAGKVTVKGTGKTTITVTAAATANYNPASQLVTINVTPKKVAKLKVRAGKKAMTITWKKDSKASGYQITYGKNKKITKGKKNITISKNKTVKKTVKKLKSKKTYYVKVRAFKKAGKTKLYGSYSSVKKVKIK